MKKRKWHIIIAVPIRSVDLLLTISIFSLSASMHADTHRRRNCYVPVRYLFYFLRFSLSPSLCLSLSLLVSFSPQFLLSFSSIRVLSRQAGARSSAKKEKNRVDAATSNFFIGSNIFLFRFVRDRDMLSIAFSLLESTAMQFSTGGLQVCSDFLICWPNENGRHCCFFACVTVQMILVAGTAGSYESSGMNRADPYSRPFVSLLSLSLFILFLSDRYVWLFWFILIYLYVRGCRPPV